MFDNNVKVLKNYILLLLCERFELRARKLDFDYEFKYKFFKFL